MPTFVEEIQSVAQGDDAEFRRRLSDRIETVGDAIAVLEEWTESSRETHAELSSKYDTAKTLARDEIREATGADAEDVPAEDLVSHSAVTDRTKQLLSEYSTKLCVFLDEERSYEGARGELLDALGAELALYERLSGELGDDATSVRDAQEAIARFAREETPGRASRTATDVLLESGVDEAAFSEEQEPG
jgi:hypothetical protein